VSAEYVGRRRLNRVGTWTWYYVKDSPDDHSGRHATPADVEIDRGLFRARRAITRLAEAFEALVMEAPSDQV
jgi:hypothetical protein